MSISVSDRGGLLATQEDLLEGVRAKAETQGLEWDDLVGRDVPEVDLGAEAADEPGLRGLRRGFEDDVSDVDLVRDFVDEAGAHLAGGAEDPRRPGLARLGDDFPRAGGEL